MPSIVNGGTFVPFVTTAPAASESASSFVITANTFFLSLWLMARDVNGVLSGISVTALPVPPSAGDSDFAGSADVELSDLPQLVTDVNTIISTFFLPCSPITTLPATPSRGSDPTNFSSESGAFLAAMPTLRTELNAFIAALNAYNPAAPFGSHLYWELEIDANNGHSTTTAFQELKFYDTGGTLIPASGGTAFSAGSGTDGSAVSNLFDGSSATSWNRSSPTNTKVGYQFASAVAVAKIDILGGGDTVSTPPKTCRLRYSDDGATYTTAFEIWEPSWAASGVSTRTWPQDFTGGKYKGFRINVTANNGGGVTVFSEIEFRGTVGGADQTSGGISFESDTTTPDGASSAFDNNLATSAEPGGALPIWIGYYFATPVACAQYTIANQIGNQYGAKDFKLQGSTNGTWVDLNTQTAQTWSIPETKVYAV